MNLRKHIPQKYRYRYDRTKFLAKYIAIPAALPTLTAPFYIGAAVLAWYVGQVPLSEQDIKQLSWWYESTSVYRHHFTSMAGLVAISVLLVTFWCAAIERKAFRKPVIGLTIAIFAVLFASSERAVIRMGLLTGTIKIGCYVKTSLECQQMLGTATTGQSRFASEQDMTEQTTPTRHATWYTDAASELPSAPSSENIRLTSIPGGALIQALAHIGKVKQLQEIVTDQRAALRPPAAKSQPKKGAANASTHKRSTDAKRN